LSDKPTVVLVHGAFANSTTWNLVLAALADQDVDAIAVANPLRSLHGDATYLRDVVQSVGRPVILVGHAYGGMVITEAAADNDAVRGLVYVAAFAPESGESVRDLAAKFPVSTPGSSGSPLQSYPLTGGGTEVRIDPAKFPHLFPDLNLDDAILLGRTQRPVTEAARTEGLAAEKPAWRTLPTWHVFGDADRVGPVELLRFQVSRSAPLGVREVAGASHAIATSRPDAVVDTILEAVAYAEGH
jgi:pimeloyl-ACP methyl ester carboxylesterase